jgi:hypothetical protein
MGAASAILGSGLNIRIRTMPIASMYEVAVLLFYTRR